MIDVRLAHLRAFLAVAETGHFGRAAERLALGQPTVSAHLRRLEQELGVELVARTSRTVALTVAGEHLVPVARAALHELEQGISEAQAVAAGELGTLRVAAQQAARGLILPGALAQLARTAPGLRLDVRPATTAQGMAALHERTVDVALARDPDPREGVRTEVLATDPIMVVLPTGHRLAGRPALSLATLRGEPRIGWNRAGAPDFHDRLDAVLRDAGLELAADMELQSVDVRLGAVAAGLGYALESAAYRWILPDQITFVAIEGEPLSGAIAAAWPAVRPAPGVEAFLAAARAAVDPSCAPR